jgi:hypothetical protein
MEQMKAEKSIKPKATIASTVGLRVKRDTKRRVMQELAKMNKKDFGKRIKADELIGLALSLLEERHLKSLQDASLTNADRVELLYREHVKNFGATSKDEFLGKILSGKVASEAPVHAPSAPMQT